MMNDKPTPFVRKTRSQLPDGIVIDDFDLVYMSDIKAYLSEHGLVAISAELPREIAESFVKEGYQLREIVKLYSLMIAAQGEEND